MRRLYTFLCFLMSILAINAEVTTYFPNGRRVESKNETASLYRVDLFPSVTRVTIELVPTKNRGRMEYWTGTNCHLRMGGKDYPLIGSIVQNEVKDCFYSNHWGWNNVKKGEKYYYTLVFSGRPPEGVTDFALIDNSNEAHGYGFSGYTINNPKKGEYNVFSTKEEFEELAKPTIIQANDPICGIYEQIGGNGYRLVVLKHAGGEYSIRYSDDKEHLAWWHPGDFKAAMEPSATVGAFKIQWWLMQQKNSSKGGFATFDGSSMSIMIDGLGEEKFIKMFPNANTSIAGITPSESSNNSNNDVWTGTGFALLNNCIATNYHVVDGAKSIMVKGVNGDFIKSYFADVVASDKYNDLAIIKLREGHIQSTSIPYSIVTGTAEVGEDVFVLGYPLTSTMGDEIKLTTGVVSARTGFQGDVSLYQISAPIQPGNSGGPLFDGKGNIIGIVSAKHQGAENVGYAIKASYLRNLAESAGYQNILPTVNRYSSNGLSARVKIAKPFVYYIICSDKEMVGDLGLSQNGKTVNRPSVGNSFDKKLTLLSVQLNDNNTILTFSNCNTEGNNSYAWVTMDPNAYIQANGQTFRLTKAEGIALSPNKTYFTRENQTIVFKLYFPAIPKNTKSINFIESDNSTWKFYDINLQ